MGLKMQIHRFKKFKSLRFLKDKLHSMILKKYFYQTSSRNLTSFYDKDDSFYYISPSPRQSLRFRQTLADHKKFFRNLNEALGGMNGNIVLDVGSNLGYWALAFDRYLLRDKSILAFEPDAENFSYLAHNTFKSLTIQAFQTGLSSKTEDLSVGMPDYVGDLSEDRQINTGYLSVLHNNDTKGKVRFTAGDKFISGFLGEMDKILCIKIDVEGFEDEVLMGLQESIANDKPAVILEINPRTQALSGYNLRDILKSFYDKNYSALVPMTEESFLLDGAGMPNYALNMILVPTEFSEIFSKSMNYIPLKQA
jgi:FkbM family methyltransferase